MAKPTIKPVENNKSKGKIYTALMTNYNSAMEQGFYGEAELIVYAFLEDRLRSFLYYSNALDARNSKTINADMKEIFGDCDSIHNISTKISIIRKAFKACSDPEMKGNEYVAFLKKVYKVSISISDFKTNLKKIEKWCSYRNEIVHAMFNKDIEELRAGYKTHVEEGYLLGRYIDKQVQALKRA